MVTNRRDELAAVPDVIGTDGDEDFSAFATSRWPGLVRLAFGLTGDRGLAEDLAQTALARTYVAWRRVSRADDPDAYLRQIMINTQRSWWRARASSHLVASHVRFSDAHLARRDGPRIGGSGPR